jgi:hypothetical protein
VFDRVDGCQAGCQVAAGQAGDQVSELSSCPAVVRLPDRPEMALNLQPGPDCQIDCWCRPRSRRRRRVPAHQVVLHESQTQNQSRLLD